MWMMCLSIRDNVDIAGAVEAIEPYGENSITYISIKSYWQIYRCDTLHVFILLSIISINQAWEAPSSCIYEKLHTQVSYNSHHIHRIIRNSTSFLVMFVGIKSHPTSRLLKKAMPLWILMKRLTNRCATVERRRHRTTANRKFKEEEQQ